MNGFLTWWVTWWPRLMFIPFVALVLFVLWHDQDAWGNYLWRPRRWWK